MFSPTFSTPGWKFALNGLPDFIRPEPKENMKTPKLGDIVHINELRHKDDADYIYYYKVVFKTKKSKITLSHLLSGRRRVINERKIIDNLGPDIDIELEKSLYKLLYKNE